MKHILFGMSVLAAALWVTADLSGAWAASSDEAQIKALEDQFVTAVNSKNLDAIMKVYVGDESLHVFDVTPPRQYVGAKAYRKDWEGFLAGFKGPIKMELTELAIVSEGGTIAYSHSAQRITGTDAKGKSVDFIARVTDGYRKIGGKWYIAHEHVSVPVDLDTLKPDLKSK